jgi:hypothetical protein
MSIHRLRKLAGLNESIGDTPEINAEIERRLLLIASDLRTPVLDALEIIKDAGKPISLSDWATKVREMYSDNDMPMAEILKTAVKEFPIVISKVAPKIYQWQIVRTYHDEPIDDETTSSMGDQINLTQDALNIMKKFGSFTIDELKRRLSAEVHLPPMVISAFVEHLLQNFSGMLIKSGDRYSIKTETPLSRTDTMQQFRDIVTKKY